MKNSVIVRLISFCLFLKTLRTEREKATKICGTHFQRILWQIDCWCVTCTRDAAIAYTLCYKTNENKKETSKLTKNMNFRIKSRQYTGRWVLLMTHCYQICIKTEKSSFVWFGFFVVANIYTHIQCIACCTVASTVEMN